jgi:DNA mismatch repair protein MutL
MSGIIHILDEDIANKIAAGEVVENPASIVKELVENSIDAGSTRVEVEIRDGGKELIRVSDNGKGMNRGDAVLAFQRHATSKIRDTDDLFSITTLGFRGEALPSIAAVSRVELITRTWEDVIGTKVQVDGGKVLNVGDIGAPVGTNLVVRDLFYNTPARLKYLKSSAAEGRRVADMVNHLILAHPDVSFHLVRDGEEVVKSSGGGKLLDSIASVYGLKVAKEMFALGAGSEGFRIRGYVGSPAVARKNRSYQRIIVNGRPIRNSLIQNAVERAYDTLLPSRTFPVFLIVIDLDPGEVDVNVHPTKAEVKFADDSFIFTSVLGAVRQALRSSDLTHQAGDLMPGKFKDTGASEKEESKSEELSIPLFTLEREAPSDAMETPEFISEAPLMEVKEELPPEVQRVKEEYIPPQVQRHGFGEYRILGQIHRTYLVLERQDDLLLMDQHAAHERILFHRLREREREQASQQLLAPLTLELTPGEVDAFFQVMDPLREMGFDLEYFGVRAFIIRAVPAFLNRLALPEGLKEIVDELQDERSMKGGRNRREESLHMLIACKAAIKAGDELSGREMEALVQDLIKTQDPYTCPHGRPTIVSFSANDLARLFKRI